jgi:hypothetical protein
MVAQSAPPVFVGLQILGRLLSRLDQSKRARFLAVALSITPLIVFTKWFGVIHGTFTYDDLDILAAVRTMPLAQLLLVLHGDATIPLFRLFFAGMYALFDVKDAYWNIYFLFLILAVNLTALAILIALDANLVVAALFYLAVISAQVWSYVAVGYYSMSIYPQIGLLGLIGVLAIILWRSGGSPNYRWLAIGVSALAPFIHPSGAYVPVAVGGFAFVSELGKSGASWSPLRMFAGEFRWLTIGLVVCVIIFAVYFAYAVSRQNEAFLTMAHSPLSLYAVAKSMFLLVSQGMAFELLKPYVLFLLPAAGKAERGAAALLAVTIFCVVGCRRVTPGQRWMFLALLTPALVNITVVSFGRRLAGIDDVLYSAGKYNSFAYLWFAIAVFYLASCLVGKIPPRWRQASAAGIIAIAGAVFVQYVLQDNRWTAEGPARKQQLNSLVATFANYAAKTAGAPIHIPTLDGPFIYRRYDLLFRYNLNRYRPFFGGFDGRLDLLRNASMDEWGMDIWGRAGTRTVPSLRQATDPDFIRALETDHDLQDLYLRGIDIASLPAVRVSGEAQRFDEALVSNATSIVIEGDRLSFSTNGDASLIVRPGSWDPEQAHILTLHMDAALSDPKPFEEPHFEILFGGQLPIPYAANMVTLPKTIHDISVDLLQLYSYSLNPQVGKLTLRFPRAGTYAISGVRLTK